MERRCNFPSLMQADDCRGLTAFRVDSIIFQNDGNGSFSTKFSEFVRHLTSALLQKATPHSAETFRGLIAKRE
jgi:hypothetical protein